MRYRDLKDYGYTDDEIYGDPDYEPDACFVDGLCSRCDNADGPEWNDRCRAYNDMPLYMVHRKKKCKRFKEPKYYD